MTAVEMILIVIGVTMMIGSFFIAEKLSQQEINQISELSSAEMKHILEKNMESAAKKVENLVDDIIDQSMEVLERAMDKETNQKIQAISEYSDTVMESIQKTHNEVMFLYSMLSEKHSELSEYAGKLQKLQGELEQLESNVTLTLANTEEMVNGLSERAQNAVAVVKAEAMVEPNEPDPEEPQEEVIPEPANNNRNILMLYQQGKTVMEIAKQLGLGLGEVKLVIGLYREEEA